MQANQALTQCFTITVLILNTIASDFINFPLDLLAASGLAVAVPAAADGGPALSDDDASAPSATSSDDPLSPGSRAHVESMYNDALYADDGAMNGILIQ